MAKFAEIDVDAWGYRTATANPAEIVARFVAEVKKGILRYDITSIEVEDSTSKEGFRRVYAELPVSAELFDLFFNARSGYRAQYFAGEEIGELYNALAVAAVAPLLSNNDKLYTAGVDRELCEKSLAGPDAKLWFPKEVTSPDYEAQLLQLPEVILANTWVEYWRHMSPPRKGLLAPRPEKPAILLNGSFVHRHRNSWNQKPGRSHEIATTGWT